MCGKFKEHNYFEGLGESRTTSELIYKYGLNAEAIEAAVKTIINRK